MTLTKRFWLILILFILFVQYPSAASDDITLPGSGNPIYQLDQPFSEQITRSEGEILTVTVSDVLVEADRILIRFYIADVPVSMKGLVTDNTRLYGSYLPIAEIADAKGGFWTPSSASKYSFLEYNSRLIIGGLLIFDCGDMPEAFYLNFNQIPFDTAPLKEGFTRAIVLSPAKGSNSRAGVLSESSFDLEFSLTASAQTNDITMIQPAVRMLREDEILSKFGWISFTDTASGKHYAVTRENLYGFNLTDDAVWSPAHAFVFRALSTEDPVRVTMDHAYIVRTFSVPYDAELDLSGKLSGLKLSLSEGLALNLSEISSFPTEDRIRIYMDCGDIQPSDISISFPDQGTIFEPTVYCGIDPSDDRFACDLFFDETAFPVSSLKIRITAVEYLKEGPWSFFWNPVPMDPAAEIPSVDADPFRQTFTDTARDPEQPEEVRAVLESIRERSEDLMSEPGWIRECTLLDYTVSGEQDLIQTDQYNRFYLKYITENFYAVGNDQRIHENLSIIRDPETNEIISANLEKDGITLDLIHALKIRTDTAVNSSFSCFSDFTDITRSSAVFISEDDCSDEKGAAKCLSFYHSLTGTQTGKAYQSIVFRIDPEDNFILGSEIDYDRGSLLLRRTTLALERTDLPEEVRALMDSIYE